MGTKHGFFLGVGSTLVVLHFVGTAVERHAERKAAEAKKARESQKQEYKETVGPMAEQLWRMATDPEISKEEFVAHLYEGSSFLRLAFGTDPQ